MSDQISLQGKEYISSKRASELSGYSQDYIGQLSRAGQIEAQRIGGLWYVSMESLQNYKIIAETYKPQPPLRKKEAEPDTLVTFDGKDYVSASRAAKLTGYHQDYVGQLARLSTVLSRQVGNRWYVEREGILAHKKEKDALLAEVQADSVGLRRPEAFQAHQDVREGKSVPLTSENEYFTYTTEEGDLMPVLHALKTPEPEVFSTQYSLPTGREGRGEEKTVPIPIRLSPPREILGHKGTVKHVKSRVRTHGKSISYAVATGMVFTIVIVLMFGFSAAKNPSSYANATRMSAYSASAAEAVNQSADFLENLLVPELSYKRTR